MLKMVILIFSLIGFAAAKDQAAHYVGDKSCIECHSKEVEEWKGSDHDLAMKVANDETVLGDFNSSSYELHGVKSSFFKKGGKFFIRTDGPDGKLHDYEVAYTFGFYPLQQYLIKFPDGKYQVPDIAWDSRSEAEGGQRWYHIHEKETILAGDVLHWTGQNFNWNFMCADCHSTNLKKNYNPKTKKYHTTWDVINVSCEACHGPASGHMEWTKTKDMNVSNSGFAVTLLRQGRHWLIDKNTLTPKPIDSNSSNSSNVGNRYPEIEVCAKCHSRRSQLNDSFEPGDRYHNHYLPSMLEKGLYFPDGKIQDEVYVYDSFLQSKMYAKGVTCTNCHNPHTLKRKADGDAICYSCHRMEKYKNIEHHHHPEGSTGASCVNCHMPSRTYMGVDNRNDHSFRLPRPDISVELPEVPNACNNCHKDKNASWAVEAMKSWYGKIPVGKQKFAHALHSLRENSADAPKSLYGVLMSDAPVIAKATVTGYLGHYPSRQTYTTTLQMLRNKDGNIRRNAMEALEAFPPKMRISETFKMLKDPLLTVRMEAARQLTAFPLGKIDQDNKKLFDKVLKEYKDTLMFNADRPESQLSLASLYSNLKQNKKAEAAYREALRLQPQFVPSYVNYSDFLFKNGRDSEALKILQEGIKKIPDIAALHYSLGLWYVRNKESEKAVEELKKAAELDRDNTGFAYAYAVSIGKENPREAIKILLDAYRKHTGDIRIVSGLAYYYKEVGENQKAEEFRKKMQKLQHFSVR